MIETITEHKPMYAASSSGLPMIEGGMISGMRYSLGRIVVSM
jgi:hypothetical protein